MTEGGRPALVECPIDYSDNQKVWTEELNNLVCDVCSCDRGQSPDDAASAPGEGPSAPAEGS